MKNEIKILFIEGNIIDSSIKPIAAELSIDKEIVITGEYIALNLSKINSVNLKRVHKIGTYIEILNDTRYYLITIPRIHINIGNGFAIINRSSTEKLYKELVAHCM